MLQKRIEDVYLEQGGLHIYYDLTSPEWGALLIRSISLPGRHLLSEYSKSHQSNTKQRVPIKKQQNNSERESTAKEQSLLLIAQSFKKRKQGEVVVGGGVGM